MNSSLPFLFTHSPDTAVIPLINPELPFKAVLKYISEASSFILFPLESAFCLIYFITTSLNFCCHDSTQITVLTETFKVTESSLIIIINVNLKRKKFTCNGFPFPHNLNFNGVYRNQQNWVKSPCNADHTVHQRKWSDQVGGLCLRGDSWTQSWSLQAPSIKLAVNFYFAVIVITSRHQRPFMHYLLEFDALLLCTSAVDTLQLAFIMCTG